MQARVASLFLYPVKACAGVAASQLVFDKAQRIVGDREWAITDADGQVTWQGAFARLALVQPGFEGEALALCAEGVETVRVAVDDTAHPCTITLWNEVAQRNDTFAAHDAGAGARRFLQAVTGADLRLVRLGPEARTRDSANPVHLMAQASLDEVNQTLELSGHAPAEMARFRPNIVLDGDALLPFLEEHLESLRWNDGELHVTQPCVRCIVPNVNPRTGEVDAEPAPTVARLSAMRRPGAPSMLGIYLQPARAAVLAQGTGVELSLSL